jgi:hypothetical protein
VAEQKCPFVEKEYMALILSILRKIFHPPLVARHQNRTANVQILRWLL